MTGEQLAKQFHNIYEALAPEFGYETREETKVFDRESKNGRLMVAVCDVIIHLHETDKVFLKKEPVPFGRELTEKEGSEDCSCYEEEGIRVRCPKHQISGECEHVGSYKSSLLFDDDSWSCPECGGIKPEPMSM